MHIVVCIKQVPDSAQIRVHPVTNTIMRQGVPTIINPYDLFALEAALPLARPAWRHRSRCSPWGRPWPRKACAARCAFGPDRAVLLTDRAFAGSDTLATSYALSQAIAEDRRDLRPGRYRLHGQADHRRRHRAGRPRHRQAAEPQSAHLCRGDQGAEPRGRHDHGRAPRRGRRAGAFHQASLPYHHAGRDERDPPRLDRRGAAARRAPRSSPGAPPRPASPRPVKCGLKGSPTVVKRVFAPAAAFRKSLPDRSRRPCARRSRRERHRRDLQAPAFAREGIDATGPELRRRRETTSMTSKTRSASRQLAAAPE